MSSFTGPLTMTQLANWRVWRLEHDLTYYLYAGLLSVTVPRGFITDGASIPRPLWWLLPTWGRYSRAAVVHDYLVWRLHEKDPHDAAPTRRVADAIFYDALKVCKVHPPMRLLLWAGVRLGGMLALRRNIVDEVNK